MKFHPRPWQDPMIGHILENRRCNVWADMGSGKTSAVLTALDILQVSGSKFFPALVIAPLRVARGVWPPEGQAWDHTRRMRIMPIIGDADHRKRALRVGADMYTINYENLPWLVDQCGANWPFKIVIADESTRLKNFRLRAGGVRAHALSQVAQKTHRWVNLTGTAAPNGLKDLWGQAWFLDFGQRLGKTWTAFKDRWFDYDQYTMEINPKAHAESQIIGALKDVTLSIQMKDWLDLKEPVVSTVFVDLPDKLRQQYKELEKKMFVQLSEHVELNASTAATLTTKCLQFAAGAVYHGDGGQYAVVHDAKLDALESIVEETAGANLVVFYWWKHDLERIKKRFKQARELKDAVDEQDWNSGKIPMLLAHPMSAGHGLNLQHGGHHIVWFSKWWSLETYAQANERLGPVRQMQSGYDRLVYHHHITVRGTVDADVAARLQSKATVQEILMNAMKKRGNQ